MVNWIVFSNTYKISNTDTKMKVGVIKENSGKYLILEVYSILKISKLTYCYEDKELKEDFDIILFSSNSSSICKIKLEKW